MEASSVLWKETKDRVATNSNAQVYWYKLFFFLVEFILLDVNFFLETLLRKISFYVLFV